MERGVDRRRTGIEIEGGVSACADHVVFSGRLESLVLARGVELLHRDELVLIERGEVFALARAEVAAGTLDPADLDGLAGERVFSTIFAEVLPPPVLVMRWSLPRMFER